jgi:hypothetical protein
MSTAAVLLDAREPPPLEVAAAIFEQAGGFPRPAALRLAQRARWFAWENAPTQAAAAVCRGLVEAGYSARVVAQHDLVPQAAPRRVHVLQLDEAALGVQLKYTGPPEWIPWANVLVLSAGAIKTETTKTEVHETVTAHGQLLVDSRVQVDISRTILADVYALGTGGGLHYFRLNSHEVNYAQTIGGSIQEGWREKFALLLARLGLKATAALISPETESLLAAGLIPDAASPSPYFAGESDFAQYNRWLATRQRLGLSS